MSELDAAAVNDMLPAEPMPPVEEVPVNAALQTVAAPVVEPPRTAVWEVNEPAQPWCPPEFADSVRQAIGETAFDGLLAQPAHERGQHVRAGAWHVTGALRRGRRHAHVAAFNEDALFLHANDARGVMVVADGAGSAPFSRLGSAVAVEIIGTALRDSDTLSEAALQHAVERAVAALQAIATAANVPARALRTTVLVAAWEPSPVGTRVLTTQVGDGALVIMHHDGRITRPSAGDAGDWSGEVHCFLPDSETLAFAKKACVELDVPDMAALLLVTDGVDDALYPFPRFAPAVLGQLVHGADSPLDGLSAQSVTPSLLTAASPGDTLLAWLGFEKRGENDDRTLAVALHHTASTIIPPWAPSPSA